MEMDAAYRDELLRRQVALQREGRGLLDELRLVESLRVCGAVTVHGSYVTGLMVWRDLDLAVTAPGLTREVAFETMLPLLTHPQVALVRYRHEAGLLNPTDDPRDDRYFFAIYYRTETGDEWKIDVSFWVSLVPHEESLPDELITARLTDETRLAILWIKDLWHRRPEYMVEMGSADIYGAVLDFDVRTPTQFEAYLAARGKAPT
jgi:hypothetical protein